MVRSCAPPFLFPEAILAVRSLKLCGFEIIPVHGRDTRTTSVFVACKTISFFQIYFVGSCLAECILVRTFSCIKNNSILRKAREREIAAFDEKSTSTSSVYAE